MKRETNMEDYFRSTSCLRCKLALYCSGIFLNSMIFLLALQAFFNHTEILLVK